MNKYDPDILYLQVKDLISKIGAKVLFRDPKVQFRLEHWCAAKLGMAFDNFIDECEVEVANEDLKKEYDFRIFLKKTEEYIPFQLTEVLDENRRRGDEYKSWEEGMESPVVVKPRNDHKTYLNSRIKHAIEKKKNKKYKTSKELHLLLHLNLDGGQCPYNFLQEITQDYKKYFAGFWFLNDKKIGVVHGLQKIGIEKWYILHH